MGVSKYTNSQGTFWKVDERIRLQDGRIKRIRQFKIPTKEQAVALLSKWRAQAFEGRFFEKPKALNTSIPKLWEVFEPVSRRDKDSYRSDVSRAKDLIAFFGDRPFRSLNQLDVDEYRNWRLTRNTRRKKPPAPATLDLDLALAKRLGSYGVECGLLDSNPLEKVSKLNRPNVRKVTVDEQTFAALCRAADAEIVPIMIVAYDTGMRKGEILGLRWSQIDLRVGSVKLTAEETKTNFPRTVYLTERVLKTLKAIPRRLGADYVFVNPETGTRWEDVMKSYRRACKRIGRPEVWFHDLRRSFVTNARRRGVPESVVMRMSGHRTRNVFDRYNIVEDEDVRNAVKVIEAGAARDLEAEKRAAVGQDLDTEGRGTPRKHEGPTS